MLKGVFQFLLGLLGEITHSPIAFFLTNFYIALYTPPIFLAKSIQAEKIISVVEISLWGWLVSNLSEIAAVLQFAGKIVKKRNGRMGNLTRTNLEIIKTHMTYQ
ncbi:MAG: hypothetical protein HKO79_07980 [Desulfobacterales bacterium]|nr:hypothetical protein [Deltaproteobacteria bacterium]NNK86259.1 hypothetical protein [Desulfobacterales bacterium]NNL42420.1 hypothetical protein [Desulfobacterales bacterium]